MREKRIKCMRRGINLKIVLKYTLLLIGRIEEGVDGERDFEGY